MQPADLERARLAIAKTRRLTSELRVGLEEANGLGRLTPERLDAMSGPDRNALLAFLKRFENAVEAGRRLFRMVVVIEGGVSGETGMLEALREAERAGVLMSMAGWRDVTDARNAVAHEYALSPDAAAAAIEDARAAAAGAVTILEHALGALAQPPFSALLGEPPP